MILQLSSSILRYRISRIFIFSPCLFSKSNDSILMEFILLYRMMPLGIYSAQKQFMSSVRKVY